jgi:hypothetical protein
LENLSGTSGFMIVVRVMGLARIGLMLDRNSADRTCNQAD